LLERTVLKENEIFLVSDQNGDIASHNVDGQGLYWRDTRFLSLYELTLEGDRPVLLSATGEHNFMTNLQFANGSFTAMGGLEVAARTISIRRNRFLHGGLHERLGFFNYNRFPVRLRLCLAFGSDFRDMFDIRGYARRSTYGSIDRPRVEERAIALGYLGLDGIHRTTTVRFDRTPAEVEVHEPEPMSNGMLRALPGISGHGDPRAELPVRPFTATATFHLEIPSGEFGALTVQIVPHIGEAPPAAPAPSLDEEFLVMRQSYERWEASCTAIRSDHEIFNAVIRRSLHDLRLLSDQVPSGYLPSAGIPWFSVPFGRDSLITAVQTLCLQPELARATLRFLADHQGTEVNDWRDEQPGKILHEVRLGEMARLGQVPHTPYYGSVDATPLFLVTLGEYLRWTGDWDLGRELQPNVEAALRWIDEYGDLDGDGYVEYLSRSDHGIRNQGWKDSHDSIRYREGGVVEPPVALAEVQGYVYRAKLAAAKYFDKLGGGERAAALRRQAAELRERFVRDWWIEEDGCFAIAMDPAKRLVRAVSSNPGHCLWAGLLDDEHARRLGRRLLADDMLCGWGIRTLSSDEPSFNPMSYHNGSVWPHDNSLIASGLKRYGMDDLAMRVADEVIDAAVRFPSYRLPELYCGFQRDRRYFSMPARYPVSCSPQAWAAGSVFLIVQSMLGMRADADAGRLTLRPSLLGRIQRLTVRNLLIGGHRVDLECIQEPDGPRVEVERSDPIDVVVESPGAVTAGSR
jgi:glycogen debranching enzyme